MMNGDYKDKIDQLIINSPFGEPQRYWEFDRTKKKFFIKDRRRKAGYVVSPQNKKYTDQGQFIELPLVNKIRPRVKKWREGGYQGATGVSKRLLEFWYTKEAGGRAHEFFFCQLEAIETLIWFKEAPPSERVGIEIKGDGGDFERLCCKMATGTGKTYVMAMTIVWQILNKIAYPQDARFSKNIFVVAPNLTVKSRLDVLYFNKRDNYYEQNKIVPYDMLPSLRQGRILIENWHTLMWEDEEQLAKRKTVDKRRTKSDEAWIRDVLGTDMAKSRNILVINDEAHHAWRHKQGEKLDVTKNEERMATCWIEGLDRINKARGILTCFDFSATPFTPSGKKKNTDYKEDLFNWIVSDFGLMDAIEAGLTKTPRFVVRDDGPVNPKDYKSKLYHIYDDESVKGSLTKKAKPTTMLPDLVRNGYLLLGHDWQKTLQEWEKGNMPTPPVMISVVNLKQTAERVENMFVKERFATDELCDQDTTLLIYSDIESGKEEDLRRKVNTVGKIGEAGEQIRHVISVAMLTEGWNCQTVTHIMGLRAFSSQLLCEQIVGRGLRRTSYDLKNGMFTPEYVNIFGIPFAYIPHEDADSERPRPESPRLPIYPDPLKEKHKITWPNVERIDYDIRPRLSVDFAKVEPLEIAEITGIVDLAPKIDGQPDYDKIETIHLKKLIAKAPDRLQEILFRTAARVYEQMGYDWQSKINQPFAIQQILTLVERFLKSDKFKIRPESFQEDKLRRKIAIIMGMEQIVRKILQIIVHQNYTKITVRYKNPRYGSTKDAIEWRTIKETAEFKKTHLNLCAIDSAWEKTHGRELDRNANVEAWVKNDHLGFEIPYVHDGMHRTYTPDFIVRLNNGDHLVLEVKGEKRDKDSLKWEAMREWVKAVSQDKDNGRWHFEVSYDQTGQKVHEIIEEIMKTCETR